MAVSISRQQIVDRFKGEIRAWASKRLFLAPSVVIHPTRYCGDYSVGIPPQLFLSPSSIVQNSASES